MKQHRIPAWQKAPTVLRSPDDSANGKLLRILSTFMQLYNTMTTEQLTLEFEKCRGQLKSYIFRITACVEDAEDIVQDTFIRALEKLKTFRGDSSLKTWVFTIASNLAKDNLRAQKRWTENVNDIAREEALANPKYFPEMMHIQATSANGQFELKEHIAFCFTCVSKSLPLEQQLCIYLKEIYEFKISEITNILNSTEAMVKYYLHTGRTKMISIFDGRCALINKQGTCHQCSELNGIFNPKQNFEVEKNKIEMAKVAKDGDKEYLLDLRLQILKGIDPFNSSGSDFQIHHLEHNREIMEKIVE
jgi:RNA polymerase sigma-70 factor (ECF subfamily)